MHPFFEKLLSRNADLMIEMEFAAELLLANDESRVDQALAACPSRMLFCPEVAAIVDHVRKTRDRDPVGICRALKDSRAFKGNSLPRYLGELVELAVGGSGAWLLQRASHVIDNYRTRTAQDIGRRLVGADAKQHEIGALLRECEAALAKLQTDTYSPSFDLPGLMGDVLSDLDSGAYLAKRPESGIAQLDSHLGGFDPGTNTLVCALTSVGKSAFLQSCALSMAKQDYHVLLFSCEMTPKLIGERFLVMESQLTHNQQRNYRDLRKADKDRLVEAANRIGKHSIDIVYSPGWTVEKLIARVHQEHAKSKVDVVMVDYLQLMLTEQNISNKEERIDSVAEAIANEGRKLGIATLVAAQLNAEAEGKSPEIRHLRGSKGPTHHADNVLLLSRNKREDSENGRVLITLGKVRNGPIGKVTCGFNPKYYAFESSNGEF